VRPVFRPVTRDVEGGETSCMFAELVTPEIAIGLVLCDPEFVHEGEEVEFAEGGEEGGYAGPGVFGNGDGGAR